MSRVHLRRCPVCESDFRVIKPSQKQRCCSHRCAFTEIRAKVHAAAHAPEAVKKRADKRRGTGSGYVKRDGRHEHRAVMESMIGRPLLPTEIVHHRDENKANNHPDNLQIVTRAEHARIHSKGKR